MFWIGDTQRSISSTAIGIVAGSATQLAPLVGMASSWYMPPLITWRVVSSPPIEDQQRLLDQRLVVEPVAVDLGVHEDAHQVVAGCAPALGDHAA